MTETNSSRRVSSVDVADHAGVSQATVSRVLSGKGQVSEATRERVLGSLDELGYQPNVNARALKTQRTQTVAVVVADITNPFYPELVEALNEELASHGQLMLLWDDATNGDNASITAAIQQGIVDGAIFATALDGSRTLQRAADLKLPVVLVNRSLSGLQFDSVTSENREGGGAVAEYFHANGRRPAVISGPKTTSTGRDRAEGFADQWKRYALDEELYIEYTHFSSECGSSFLRSMMNRPNPPDAIFATNDYTAFGVLDEAKKQGIAVPDDLWVVGYDDIAMSSWASFDLTTVRQPTAQMAHEAVRLLLSRLDDRDRSPEAVRFGGEFIIRGTTAGVPVI